MATRNILIVDDDEQVNLRSDLMVQGNLQILFAPNVTTALELAQKNPDTKFGVFDMRLDVYAPYSGVETEHGKRAGLRLLRDLEDLLPNAKFVFKTNSREIGQLREMVQRRPSVVRPFIVDGYVEDAVIERIANEVYSGAPPNPWILIVHGHDRNAVSSLQGLLLRRYGLKEVHVLRDLPDQGRTVIEKFEHFARRADLVFALMTDDDALAGGEQKRARQNVIFEIGYFCSALQRTSGRLVLLERRGIEIPSDMRGLLTIDISDGVDTADTRERIDSEFRAIGIRPTA